MMTEEEINVKLEIIKNDELYKKSKSIHKSCQFKEFRDDKGHLLDGHFVVIEDCNMIPEGAEGFDKSSSRPVIYSFRLGLLHSDDGKPAVQYRGHWEIWDAGLLQKVVSDGGNTVEFWENGVPVCIETDCLGKRRKEVL